MISRGLGKTHGGLIMSIVLRIQLLIAAGLFASTAHASHLAQGTRIITTMKAQVRSSPSSQAALLAPLRGLDAR